MACGLWLIRFTISVPRAISPQRLKRFLPTSTSHFLGRQTQICTLTDQASTQAVELQDLAQSPTGQDQGDHNQIMCNTKEQRREESRIPETTPATPSINPQPLPLASQNASKDPPKPLCLYPASILGFAMVTRGEIGFLISSLANSNGIFSSAGNDDIFLIVTWAIVLCTVIGPIGVGLLVKRLRRLEIEKEESGGGRRDVLGVWGIQ